MGELIEHAEQIHPVGITGFAQTCASHLKRCLLIWLPILGGFAALAFGAERAPQVRWFALLVTLATFVLSIPLFTGFDYANAGLQFLERREWIPSLDIEYHLGADGISVALIILTTLTTALVLIGGLTMLGLDRAMRVRARFSNGWQDGAWEPTGVEKLAGGTWQLVVSEIPYQVQKGKLIEQIAQLIADKKLPILDDIRDESDEHVRIVLVPKSRNVDPEDLKNALFRLTDLETRFSINMKVLYPDLTPKDMG